MAELRPLPLAPNASRLWICSAILQVPEALPSIQVELKHGVAITEAPITQGEMAARYLEEMRNLYGADRVLAVKVSQAPLDVLREAAAALLAEPPA